MPVFVFVLIAHYKKKQKKQKSKIIIFDTTWQGKIETLFLVYGLHKTFIWMTCLYEIAESVKLWF